MTSIAGRRLPRRIAQLLVGLFLYGIGIAFMVRGAIGAAPWDVLTQGIANHVPLSFGLITICVSVVVLLLWIPLRQRLGIGTILNALLVGPSADVGFWLLPSPEMLWLKVLFFVIGLVTLAAATGLYIGANFGPGPRDGLMTGLARRTGWSLRAVRTGLEVSVVLLGWALGGVLGVATIAYALAVGPLVQFCLPWFTVALPEPTGEPAAS